MKYSGGKQFPHGIITALITPFRDNGIDYEALKNLINRHIEQGAQAVVLLGTTGEAPAVTDSERKQLIEFCLPLTKGKLFLIVGCGSNSTEKTVSLAKEATEMGADGLLAVTPYYNKPNESGLIRHYLTLAEAVDLPIMLYNVPSRTGVNLSPKCAELLLAHENICALKEAGTDFSDITEKLIRLKEHDVFCGNDLYLPYFCSLGSAGLVSVASNVCFTKLNEIFNDFNNGKNKDATKKYETLYPFLKALCADTNPILIKAVMAELGLSAGKLRLPLIEADNSAKRNIMYAASLSGIKI